MMALSRGVTPLVVWIALCVAVAAPALADTNATATPSPAATVAGPGVGAVAPKVALQSVFGGKEESFDLQSAAAAKPIVLYFFPAAFSSGWIIEARAFAARLADIDKLGYTVVGISTDDIPTLTKFQHDESAPQRFVSDPDGKIASAFGIAGEYKGKTYAGRVTFVIGTDGKIRYKLDDEVPQSNVATTLDWLKAHPAVKNGSWW